MCILLVNFRKPTMKSIQTTGSARMAREWEVLEKMVHLYCEHRHHRTELCEECQQLLRQSRSRQQTCRYGADKPICANCSYGCYGQACREKIREVIGTARPFMVLQHPGLTMRYWLDSFHRVPIAPIRVNFGSWGGE
jgi:hypothetical protein